MCQGLSVQLCISQDILGQLSVNLGLETITVVSLSENDGWTFGEASEETEQKPRLCLLVNSLGSSLLQAGGLG